MTARPLAIVSSFAVVAALGGLLAAGCGDEPDPMPLLPQIFPHVNPINFCEVEVPAEGIPRQVSFDLMLVNGGQQRLEISSFDVSSDRNCAFAEPNGDVRLFDDDPEDELLATARSREAAFMRIRYSPPGVGEDEITINIHSNAENFPEPDGVPVYVCAAGKAADPEGTTLSCRIRMDPACSDAEAGAYTCDAGPEAEVANPCPSFCYQSGAECRPPTVDDPVGLPCPEGDNCQSPWYCVPGEDPTQGSCMCRPCAVPPDEGWDDCAAE